MHSRDYREPYGFLNKRVVVIGIGNSGGDLSVELGCHAEKVCVMQLSSLSLQKRWKLFKYLVLAK